MTFIKDPKRKRIYLPGEEQAIFDTRKEKEDQPLTLEESQVFFDKTWARLKSAKAKPKNIIAIQTLWDMYKARKIEPKDFDYKYAGWCVMNGRVISYKEWVSMNKAPKITHEKHAAQSVSKPHKKWLTKSECLAKIEAAKGGKTNKKRMVLHEIVDHASDAPLDLLLQCYFDWVEERWTDEK